jgi:hypothetical protein
MAVFFNFIVCCFPISKHERGGRKFDLNKNQFDKKMFIVFRSSPYLLEAGVQYFQCGFLGVEQALVGDFTDVNPNVHCFITKATACGLREPLLPTPLQIPVRGRGGL